MVDDLHAVLAPAAVLTEVADAEILLVSLGLWTRHVIVHTAARSTTITDEIDRAFERSLLDWSRGRLRPDDHLRSTRPAVRERA